MKKTVDIKYIIKIGDDLFLKNLGRKGVEFTKNPSEAVVYKSYDDEFEKECPVVLYIKVQVDSLFKLGFRDIKVIESKTVIEYTEQRMIFEEITGEEIKLIPSREERFDF